MNSKLYTEILNARAYARANKHNDSYSILTVLVGEVETAFKRDGTQPTDEMVTKIITKMIKSNTEVYALRPSANLKAETEFLESLLPKVNMLSEDEIRAVIKEHSNMGDAMKALKTQYNGSVDMKLASAIAKAHFS